MNMYVGPYTNVTECNHGNHVIVLVYLQITSILFTWFTIIVWLFHQHDQILFLMAHFLRLVFCRELVPGNSTGVTTVRAPFKR